MKTKAVNIIDIILKVGTKASPYVLLRFDVYLKFKMGLNVESNFKC